MSLNTAKGLVRKAILKRWQTALNRNMVAHDMHYHQPKIPTTKYTSTQRRPTEIKILRLKSEHNRLNGHMFRLGFTDSPSCACGHPLQNEHFLMHCSLNTDARNTMVGNIERIYVKDNTPIAERSLDLQTLLWPSHSNKATRNTISDIVFLKTVKTKMY